MSVSGIDTAFNAGSDARIAGLPLSANPIPNALRTQWSAWRWGWRDADEHWATEAKRPVRRLPEVLREEVKQ